MHGHGSLQCTRPFTEQNNVLQAGEHILRENERLLYLLF